MLKVKYLLLVFILVLLCGCGESNKVDSTISDVLISENVSETVSIVEEKKTQEEVQIPSEDQTTEASIVEEIIEEPSYDIIPEVYAYSLTISINPLVELYFDSDNVVVGIGYLNQDAIDAYSDIEIIGQSLDSGINTIIQSASDQGYIKEDATVEIELAKVSDESQEAFDVSILADATKFANETINEINRLSDEVKKIEIEIAVNETVVEEKGITAPAICEDCNGTGNNCTECNGTAIVKCKRCTGGVETCGICNGTKSIKCHGCHGAGGDCGHCGGSGTISCDACGGRGSFNCSWCGGALEHVCPICWGEGSCPTCGGDGIR